MSRDHRVGFYLICSLKDDLKVYLCKVRHSAGVPGNVAAWNVLYGAVNRRVWVLCVLQHRGHQGPMPSSGQTNEVSPSFASM